MIRASLTCSLPFAAGLALCATTNAQQFDAPVELTADGKPFHGILYPSPRLHDADGDGKAELLVGDLWGHIRVARAGDTATSFGAIDKLRARDELLKLNNW